MDSELIVGAVLVVCAVIHLLPAVGALGPARVAGLYGIRVDGPDLAVLLVHRAVLFGLLGAALVVAVVRDEVRPYAVGAALVSDLAFLVIVRANPGVNELMRRVVRVDLVSTVLLVGLAVYLVLR